MFVARDIVYNRQVIIVIVELVESALHKFYYQQKYESYRDFLKVRFHDDAETMRR